jgi:DNA-binding GntR family transcriptional regulator
MRVVVMEDYQRAIERLEAFALLEGHDVVVQSSRPETAAERAAQIGDAEGARTAAAEFHEIAGELAGNDMLTELIGVFLTRLRWLFGQHDDLRAMAEEHRVILEAMAARDVDALRILIPQHMAYGQEIAARRLQAAEFQI